MSTTEQARTAGAGLTIGPATPLSAAYCAERAAAVLDHAEQAARTGAAGDHSELMGCAYGWLNLAKAIASHATLTRPRDDRNDRR